MTRQRKKILLPYRNKSSSCELKSFQLRSLQLSVAFSWLSSHYENSKSTAGYLCELKHILVDILRAFNRGKVSSRELKFTENTAETVSLFKMAAKQAMKENLQCTSKYGHLRISQDICHVG